MSKAFISFWGVGIILFLSACTPFPKDLTPLEEYRTGKVIQDLDAVLPGGVPEYRPAQLDQWGSGHPDGTVLWDEDLDASSVIDEGGLEVCRESRAAFAEAGWDTDLCGRDDSRSYYQYRLLRSYPDFTVEGTVSVDIIPGNEKVRVRVTIPNDTHDGVTDYIDLCVPQDDISCYRKRSVTPMEAPYTYVP